MILHNFSTIKEALDYIDHHLDESINLDKLAEQYHFSPFYFHRMFSIIVGRTLAVYIRDRRMLRACKQLAESEKSVLDIGIECGYNSAQSFSRAFKGCYGITPSDYRKQGLSPIEVTVDELIMKFTNRLKGGIFLNPNIIKRNALIIAGALGDGNKTWEVWNEFETMNKQNPLNNKLSDNGYEIRIYDGDKCTVHVGFAISDEEVDQRFSIFKLPDSQYASFDVYVSNGYDSENNAMDEWLKTNSEGYEEKLLNGAHYCVEYYDERFKGSETGSIVEIWIPIKKAVD